MEHSNRRQGADRIEFDDEHGGRIVAYNFTVARWQAWAAFFSTIVVLAGTVFAAARFGVQIEVREEIESQISDPYSSINRRIDQKIVTSEEARHEKLSTEFKKIAEEIATLKANQSAMQGDIGDMKVDMKELLRRVR